MQEYKSRIKKYVCEKLPGENEKTGCISDVSAETLLSDLREGFDAVFLFSCKKKTCKKAGEKETEAFLIKKILSEQGINPERLGFFYAQTREDIKKQEIRARKKIKKIGPFRWENER